jgi:D-glycero-D-manno-heptose 1,7-bisphosphate phosphatase
MKRSGYVLLDRDGTINYERQYLSHPDEVALLPHSAEGLRLLAEAGYGLVVVTNQSPVGRGMFSEERLAQIHQRLEQLLLDENVVLDGIYYCPHTPEDGCQCRKPLPGLVWRAAQDLDFEPQECFVIGDKPCDIDLGRNIHAHTILVRTGYGAKYESAGLAADYTVDSLVEAAETIIRLEKQARMAKSRL